MRKNLINYLPSSCPQCLIQYYNFSVFGVVKGPFTYCRDLTELASWTIHIAELLLRLSHVAWSVCLTVSVLGTRVSCANNGWIWGLTHVGQRNHMLGSSEGKGHFWAVYVPAHYNLPTVDECACTAHAADECIRCREGWQDGDATSCQITLRTLVSWGNFSLLFSTSHLYYRATLC